MTELFALQSRFGLPQALPSVVPFGSPSSSPQPPRHGQQAVKQEAGATANRQVALPSGPAVQVPGSTKHIATRAAPSRRSRVSTGTAAAAQECPSTVLPAQPQGCSTYELQYAAQRAGDEIDMLAALLGVDARQHQSTASPDNSMLPSPTTTDSLVSSGMDSTLIQSPALQSPSSHQQAHASQFGFGAGCKSPASSDPTHTHRGDDTATANSLWPSPGSNGRHYPADVISALPPRPQGSSWQQQQQQVPTLARHVPTGIYGCRADNQILNPADINFTIGVNPTATSRHQRSASAGSIPMGGYATGQHLGGLGDGDGLDALLQSLSPQQLAASGAGLPSHAGEVRHTTGSFVVTTAMAPTDQTSRGWQRGATANHVVGAPLHKTPSEDLSARITHL